MDQTVCRWLQFDVCSEGYTFKCQFAERNVDFETIIALKCCVSGRGFRNLVKFVTHSFGNLLRKVFEFFVESLSPFTFLLLELNFIFIAIPIFSLPVSGFVELNVRSFAVHLDILECSEMSLVPTKDENMTHLGLFLANHYGTLQMHVNNDKHFIITRLEEEMLDIAEEKIWGNRA
jgi:hypothetical protein